MNFKSCVFTAATIVAVMLSCPVFAQNKTGLHIVKQYHVKSGGGWDYLIVDARGKKLYVSHGNQVNIFNTKSGDSVGVVLNTQGVHGIALVEHLDKGYTSNGRDNSTTVFSLKNNTPITKIYVGTNPDAIFYDDFSKKVFAFNGKSNDASVIDPVTDKVIATIPLGGKPETGVSDGKGRVYVNSETTNEVIVIDAKGLKVVDRYKIAEGEEPSGLAIDRVTNRLFIGCGGNQTLVVMDAANGKNLAKFKIGDCDGVAFDPALKLIYSSNREGNVIVIKEVSADTFQFVENVATEPGARTIALDPITHHLFLPTAKTKAVAATTDNPNPRPVPIAGTFHVLELGK